MMNTNNAMEVVMVKVGKMPGTIQEVAVEKGTSVADVFELAGVTVEEGFEVRYNGNTVDMEEVVEEEGTLLLTKKVKGNADLKVGKMPGVITNVMTEDGTSAKDAFELAGMEIEEGYEIRYNGNTIEEDEVVDEDGTLLLVKKVKGNK